jgi:hypothetical protein
VQPLAFCRCWFLGAALQLFVWFLGVSCDATEALGGAGSCSRGLFAGIGSLKLYCSCLFGLSRDDLFERLRERWCRDGRGLGQKVESDEQSEAEAHLQW